ncbi:hypothetical protein H2200_013640 [Cladophialophora chaetospira]|uniref:Uncharacterized protein n=1 Tax=Cladophialophora chaetospira TaxID=386627 RepID=A0AA38WP72_9EURO|nr:hypothetical protein H2200_013640 [Cladophialophora chaetospira]
MGQYWIVTSPDQRQQISTLAWGKLGEIFPNGNAGRFLEHLLMVPPGKQCLNEYSKQFDFRLSPNDGNKEEIAKLIKPVLERLFDNYFGVWASQKIVCVGDYAEGQPRALEHIQQPLYDPYELPEIDPLPLQVDLMRKGLDTQSQRTLEDICSQLQANYFPVDQQYVLLNFTTKDYVLDRSYLEIDLPYTDKSSIRGLGDVVLSQICWTQDPSTSLECSPDLEGAWAGHGFGIVTLSIFDEMTGGREGWKDVTNERWEELGEIISAEDH